MIDDPGEMNQEPLLRGGQGRTDMEISDAANNGRVAFVGAILIALAAIVWLLLLSGCGVPKRAMPEDALRAIIQGDAK